MKKQLSILSLGLMLAASNAGLAQEETKIQPCNTYAAMEQHFAEDPSARANYEATQQKMRNEYLEAEKSRGANKTTALEYTVPVVFHILHQGGPENISDADCMAALKQINEDYARKGADTGAIVQPFRSLYIPSDIKFMLAKKDPNGNCITGVVRHVDAKTNWSQTQANAGTAAGNAYWSYTWDPTKYLNIYIVANIVPQGTVTGNGIIVGYTYRPGTWATGNNHDAIVYRYNFLTPGPPSYEARSLSHEIGHWLNLAHTFGNTNNPGVVCGSQSGGDGVADTPDTKGNFGTCPASSTNSTVVCTSGVTPYFQNVQNIMDYSSCPKNFTTGQTNVMRATLVSATSGRSNVPSATNLGASFTDVNAVSPCAPIAEFLSTTNSYTICSGASLTMQDYSYNGTINSYQWAADNGAVIAAPTSTYTSIMFNNIGVSNVSLTVTNNLGSSTKVRTVTVISSAPGITGPYMESFETASVPPAGWSIIDTPTNAPVSWQQTSAASYDGINSFYINGASTQGGQINTLQMPIIDLLNNQNSGFSFAYAYARKSSTQNDFFRVQMSSNCGGSWTDVVIKNAASMANESGPGGVTNVPYVPADKNEWAIVDVPNNYPQWYSFTNSASVLIRFSFEESSAGGGNNFYLDAVNFSTITGVNELTKSIKLSMYPNPTNGETNLNFTLSSPAAVQMNVVDILGKEVAPASSYSLGTGEQTLVVNKDNNLKKGMYFVNLSVNGAKMSRKLIIN